jgi:Uma2 family endonuclease
VVEVDIQHDSSSKLPIYAALGVPEVWRYDGRGATIYHLRNDQYTPAPSSLALPILTSHILTEFLNRSQNEDQYETLLAFEHWLQARPQ